MGPIDITMPPVRIELDDEEFGFIMFDKRSTKDFCRFLRYVSIGFFVPSSLQIACFRSSMYSSILYALASRLCELIIRNNLLVDNMFPSILSCNDTMRSDAGLVILSRTFLFNNHV